MFKSAASCLALVATLAGCSHDLPTYNLDEPDAIVSVIHERAAQVDNAAARGRLILRRPDNQELILDIATVTRGSQHSRVRAWKLDRTVVDVVSRPDGTWVWLSDRFEDQPDLVELLEGVSGDALSPMFWLGDGLRGRSDPAPSDSHEVAVVSSVSERSTKNIRFEIDPATCTIQRILIREGEQLLGQLTLGSYRLVDGIAWPMVVEAAAQYGSFRIHFDHVEVNRGVPPGAFDHIRGAVRLNSATRSGSRQHTRNEFVHP